MNASSHVANPRTPALKPCPLCSRELLLRQGKNGPFLVCLGRTGKARCEYTGDPAAVASDKPCLRCGGTTEESLGKHGPYIRCLSKPCGYSGQLDAKPCPLPCLKCGLAMEDVVGSRGPYARCLAKGCDGRRDRAAPVTEQCPACRGAMTLKKGFLSCALYPQCKGRWDLEALEQAKAANLKCPKCKTRLLRRVKGPKGLFVACSGHPACKYSESSTRLGAPLSSAPSQASNKKPDEDLGEEQDETSDENEPEGGSSGYGTAVEISKLSGPYDVDELENFDDLSGPPDFDDLDELDDLR